jgi:acyl-CoA synthetase (AMP-forming)/AMP-acid ligase II
MIWLNDEYGPTYHYSKSWDEAKDDPVVVFHTSGSTGLPKIVRLTNRMVNLLDVQRDLPDIEGRLTTTWDAADRRIYVTIPIFHVSQKMCNTPVGLTSTANIGLI